MVSNFIRAQDLLKPDPHIRPDATLLGMGGSRDLGNSSYSTARERIAEGLLHLDMRSSRFQDRFDQDGPVKTFLQSAMYPVPTVEHTHYLDIEGDVERALHLYMVNPVNLMFEDYLRRPGAPQGRTLTCKCQVTHEQGQTSSRVDMIWFVADRAILAMEVKRNGSVRPNEWDDAVPPNSAGIPLQQQVQLLKQLVQVERPKSQGFQSLIGGNAGKIMRQVTKYFRVMQPPSILVFDWGNMILLDVKSSGTSGFPHMFQTDGSGYWTFRRVLFAALIDGLDRILGGA